MTPAVRTRFDALVSELRAAGRRSFTLGDLATVHALARELDSTTPALERVQALRAELGLGAPVAHRGSARPRPPVPAAVPLELPSGAA